MKCRSFNCRFIWTLSIDRIATKRRAADLGWRKRIDVNYAFTALCNLIWFWPQCMIIRPIQPNKLFSFRPQYVSLLPYIFAGSSDMILLFQYIKKLDYELKPVDKTSWILKHVFPSAAFTPVSREYITWIYHML